MLKLHVLPAIGGKRLRDVTSDDVQDLVGAKLEAGFSASSAESVGRFWFRESSQVVIKGNFHSLVGTKAVGSSGNYSDFVVEALNGAIGDFSFGPKPIQDQRLMGAQHAGRLFHRFQTADPELVSGQRRN